MIKLFSVKVDIRWKGGAGLPCLSKGTLHDLSAAPAGEAEEGCSSKCRQGCQAERW